MGESSFSSGSSKSNASGCSELTTEKEETPKKRTSIQQSTHLEFLESLPINWKVHAIRKTGIICTLGPASNTVDIIQRLIDKGMTIARLNFSHGDYEYHEKLIVAIRQAAEKFPIRRVVSIALDTRGPEIRTGILETGVNTEIELKTGDLICLSTIEAYKNKCNKSIIFVDYKNMSKVVRTGAKVYIDDGLICLTIEKIDGENMTCKIANGGALGSKKGIILPDTSVDLPDISDKDVQDLKFAVSKNIDFIFASFIRNAKAVKKIRRCLAITGKDIKVIAKVENYAGVNNINEIIQEADGVMVSRGGLGVEMAPEKVFLAQKVIIAKCNLAGKPVICATQMLESMVRKPRPTRAEGTDVANAVLDGADCVMLCGETAKGDYPVESVKIMNDICREAEGAFNHTRFFEAIQRLTPLPTDHAQTMAVSCVSASVMSRASAIIVLVVTGRSTQLISRYRPHCPIICIATDETVSRRLLLYHGVVPLLYKESKNLEWPYEAEDRVKFALKIAKDRNYVKLNDKVVIVTGWRQKAESANSVRIMTCTKEEGF